MIVSTESWLLGCYGRCRAWSTISLENYGNVMSVKGSVPSSSSYYRE